MQIESKIIEGANFIKVTNSNEMEVVLSEFGAGIYQIKIDGAPMLVGRKDYKEWMLDKGYNGKTIGRIAGRLPSSGLIYQGKTYPLAKNEKDHTLHGGIEGFSFKKFKMELGHEGSSSKIDFYLDSLDGEEGFPGNVTVRVRYLIFEKENKVRIEYKAISDRETPISLTNHIYFNLGGERDILSDNLYIDSDEILAYDDDLLPQKYVNVPSFMDLSKKRILKDVIMHPSLAKVNGLDNAFHKNERNKDKDQIILENSSFAVNVKSSYDDVVIYSSNYPPFDTLLNNGNIHKKWDGLAVEPQYEANDFERMTVKPNEPQRNFIEYKFIKKGE